jgi:hypothetical protein
MWSYEHSTEADVATDAIWKLWTDVAGWGEWNTDIEHVEIDGPFDKGSTITMTPNGDDPVELHIVDVRDKQLFVDEAEFGGIVIRTSHHVEQLDADTARVTYRTEISGPNADEMGPQVGPAITGDFPETIDALIRLAQG